MRSYLAAICSLLALSFSCSPGANSNSGDGDSGDGDSVGGAWQGTGAASGTGGTFGTGATSGTGAGPGSGGTTGVGGSTFVPGTLYGAVCETFGGQSLDAAFAGLYAAWKADHVETCSGGARVKGCPAGEAQSTCSEGQAYGMLLAVAANDQALFDQLNAYRLDMLQSSSTQDKSLMPWAIRSGSACPPSATGGDQNSATDADIDAAMALLQAEALWGGAAYRDEAVTTLTSIMNLEVIGSGASMKLKPGNHDDDLRDYVAYYTPGYYPVFAEVMADSGWTELGAAYYTRLLANQCAANGQIYDDFQYPGECKFWYDSCRVPWRVALDYQWHQSASAKSFLDELHGFVGTNPTSVSDQMNSAFVGGAVLSAISSDDPAAMQNLCTAWAGASGLDDSPYFQKTLKLLYLAVAGRKMIRP